LVVGVLLLVIRFLAEVAAYFLSRRFATDSTSYPLDFIYLVLISLPTLGWGAILGYYAGLACQQWKNGQQELARTTLQAAGAWCITFNILWSLAFVQLVSQYPGATLTDWRLYLFLRLLTNVSLQAAVLIMVLGWVLPGNDEDTVQVTEKLRL
jgi:hypothetical protein